MRKVTEVQADNIFSHIQKSGSTEREEQLLWDDIYATTSVEGIAGDIIFDYFTSNAHLVTEVFGTREEYAAATSALGGMAVEAA